MNCTVENAEKEIRINLNECVKVKLTDLGKDIYYHQFDEVNEMITRMGGKPPTPRMPEVDKNGYTSMQLWHFIQLYGEHIGMAKPNVIEPIEIIYDIPTEKGGDE